MKTYLLVMLTIIVLTLMGEMARSYEVNVYQGTEKGTSVLEIVDDCDKSYKLVVKNEELGSSKTLNWAKRIYNNPEFCIN